MKEKRLKIEKKIFKMCIIIISFTKLIWQTCVCSIYLIFIFDDCDIVTIGIVKIHRSLKLPKYLSFLFKSSYLTTNISLRLHVRKTK